MLYSLRPQAVMRYGITAAVRCYATRLAEVGVLEGQKTVGQYNAGQLFLHRIFGYRGVVLFPWLAQVFDRNSKGSTPAQSNRSSSGGVREVKGVPHGFYQCLIDQRDVPYVRAQTESVTFLGSRESGRALYAIPGLDYAAHEDIIPYSTTEIPALNHELFDKFFEVAEVECSEDDSAPPFTLVPRETLRAWHERNRTWLELCEVHRETTQGIRITVIPFYMGCRELQGSQIYWWRYLIRLENFSQVPVQLRERNWRIFSLSGTLETVQGRGVVGQEPVLSPKQPAFQYSSHISLQAPSGHMWGVYKMERLDGSGAMFDVRIPPFSLESREANSPPNAPPGSPSVGANDNSTTPKPAATPPPT